MADYTLTQSGVEVQTALDKVGTTALTTTATNLSGAVNELDSDISTLSGTVSTLSGDVSALDTLAKAKLSPLTYAEDTNIAGSFDEKPTSSSTGTYTFTNDGWLYIYATRGNVSGYSLTVMIDGTVRFTFPAYDAYAVVDMLIPVVKNQVLKFTTDSASQTWTLRKVQFMR